MIGRPIRNSFEFFRLARYDCLHEIPRLKQVMPTALSSDTYAWKIQTGYSAACALYSSFASFFPTAKEYWPRSRCQGCRAIFRPADAAPPESRERDIL